MTTTQNYLEEIINEINQKMPEYLEIMGHPANKNNMFSCPYPANHKHGDRTPSCHMSHDGGIYKWYCNSCKTGGDTIKLAEAFEGLPCDGKEFIESIIYLSEKLGIHVDHQKLSTGARSDQVDSRVHEVYNAIEKYIAGNGNGIDALTQERFGRGYTKDQAETILGWVTMGTVSNQALHDYLLATFGSFIYQLPIYNKDRNDNIRLDSLFSEEILCMPLKDINGKILRFIGRASNELIERTKDSEYPVPKYRFTRGIGTRKKETFFLFDLAKQEIKRTRVVKVVEGQFDSLSMRLAGYGNVVSSMGTSFTSDLAEAMIRFGVIEVVIMYDGDVAGLKGICHTLDVFKNTGIVLSVVELPDRMDPDRMILAGRQSELETSINAIQYVIEKDTRFTDVTIPEITRYTEVLNFVANLVSNAYLSKYARVIATKFPFPHEEIYEDLKKAVVGIETKNRTMIQLWKKINEVENGTLDEQASLFEMAADTCRKMMSERGDDILKKSWNSYISLYKGEEILPQKLYTGFNFLDSEASLLPRTVSVWTGPPSNCKSVTLRNVAWGFVRDNPNAFCLYISLDDDDKETLLSFIAIITDMETARVRSRLQSGEWDAFPETQAYRAKIEDLLRNQLLILGIGDCPDKLAIRRSIENVRSRYPEKQFLVIIDAFNDLVDMDRDNQNAAAEAVLRDFKSYSDRYNAHVAVIAHLKKYDQTSHRRPLLKDLKGTSYLEHVARNIFIVYMDTHYNHDSDLTWYNEVDMEDMPIVEVNIAKDKSHRANVICPFHLHPRKGMIVEPEARKIIEYQKRIESKSFRSNGDEDGHTRTGVNNYNR